MLVYASGQCMEQRSCGCSQLWHSAPPGMAAWCCELRLRSTPRYRLVCICFPTPGRGLPYGSGLGLSRCLGPGECLHSFIHLMDIHHPSKLVSNFIPESHQDECFIRARLFQRMYGVSIWIYLWIYWWADLEAEDLGYNPGQGMIRLLLQ